MRISLKELQINNFKGIEALNITLGKTTNVKGDNGTCKTGVYDAFTWNLLGKDSKDRKDFEIRPLDKYGVLVKGVDPDVTVTLEVLGVDIKFRRVLKERYQKKKGDTKAKYCGNYTDFYIDDIKVSEKEYEDKVNSIIDMQLLKVLTNPLYLSKLKWADQRNIILAPLDKIEDEKVVKGNKNLIPLLPYFRTMNLDQIVRKAAAEVKTLKKSIGEINPKIEVLNSILQVEDVEDTKGKKRRILGDIREIKFKLKNSKKDIANRLAIVEEIANLKEQYYDKEISIELLGNLLDEPKIVEKITKDKENINKKIDKLQERLDEYLYGENDLDLLEKLESLQSELLKIERSELIVKGNHKIINKIKDLRALEKEYKEKLAEQEAIEVLCREFMLTKARLLEDNLNSKFENVVFNVYRTQINGDLWETFEATYKGVPFSNLNTAGQINCGIEIINTLSKIYGVSVPLFIDNRESINNIVDVNSQIINFIVTKDKYLTVEIDRGINGELINSICKAAL